MAISTQTEPPKSKMTCMVSSKLAHHCVEHWVIFGFLAGLTGAGIVFPGFFSETLVHILPQGYAPYWIEFVTLSLLFTVFFIMFLCKRCMIHLEMSEKKTLKQIEDLNQKQAQLTQVLAHDIKNSLSVISMNTELIKIKPSEVDHCVEIISQAVVQLTQLVDQFRDQQGYSVEAKSSANHSPESDLSKNKSK